MQTYTLYIMQNTSLAEGGVGAAFHRNRRERWLQLRSLTFDLASAAQGHPGSLQSFMSWECRHHAALCFGLLLVGTTRNNGASCILDSVTALRVDTAAARVGALILVWLAKCWAHGGNSWDQFLNQYLRSVFRRAPFWWISACLEWVSELRLFTAGETWGGMNSASLGNVALKHSGHWELKGHLLSARVSAKHSACVFS